MDYVGFVSSTLTQIHRKSLCQRPSVISALWAENGVHPVNGEGIFHIYHPCLWTSAQLELALVQWHVQIFRHSIAVCRAKAH